MKEKTINKVKLGMFVLAGLLFLILLLYMIGRNRNMFGRQYVLKARFENVNGLVQGNNVRYAGIEIGTVKKIVIINDTSIEVSMTIDHKMKNIIRKNAIVSIASDGLMGNKVINISPESGKADLAAEGEILPSHKSSDMDAVLQTLGGTSENIAVISNELKIALQRLNRSQAFWKLLEDPGLPGDINKTAANLRRSSQEILRMSIEAQQLVEDVKAGRGNLGILLRDSGMAQNLDKAASNARQLTAHTDSLASNLNNLIDMLTKETMSGKGTVHALLRDSSIVSRINASLDNIQKGTDGFNQNMEALKHNFLLRGYFRKLERQKK